MTTAWVKTILIICVVGQFFCGMSCMTSASRMMYAFSRDGAVPGWKAWSRVNANKIPFNAVIAVAVFALILTLPALKGNKDGVTVAFTAVVSIGVIGLYVCCVIPIFLRWRMGDEFQVGPWNLGTKYKWMAPISLLEVLIVVVIYFNVPFSPQGVPWKSDFDWSLFNYTPVVTGGLAHRHRAVVGAEREELVHRTAAHGRGDRRRARRRAARVPRGAVGPPSTPSTGRSIGGWTGRSLGTRRNGMIARPFLRHCTA